MEAPQLRGILSFTGKIVLVTGAGGGIGAGIALRFAEAGAAVVVHYNSNQDGARRIVERIEAGGGRALVVQADLRRRQEVERLVAAAHQALSAVDVLINNAGTYPLSRLTEMDDEEWQRVVDTNLRAVHLCTQIVARRMIESRRPGAIVNIASIEGENAAPLHSHYDAAKAGVIMYTRAAALELGGQGIRVNSVSPGLIWKQGLEEEWPDGVGRYLRAAPLGRLGRPEDVADACLFLASPAARWISGVNLRVDGGVGAAPGY